MAFERHLAAIMFTDLVGYSKLMAKDEDYALDCLEESRIIHEEAIKDSNGVLRKTLGDGILATFPTAADAVKCANRIISETEKFEATQGTSNELFLPKRWPCRRRGRL